MTIQEIMTPTPITLHIEDNITKAIERVKEYKIHHLPIIDDENNVVGIVSQSDLYQNALSLSKVTSGKSFTAKVLFNTPVSEIMTLNPTTICSDKNVDEAVELLVNSSFHALPVIFQDRVVGVVTAKDILEAISKTK